MGLFLKGIFSANGSVIKKHRVALKGTCKEFIEQVQENFKRFDLLDDKVKFLKGWFKDTLPSAPIDHLAIIRLDGDMYESTMDGLVNLYHKLSSGGFIIIDDYGTIPACKKAVHDFRDKNGITEEIINIDDSGYYWQKN